MSTGTKSFDRHFLDATYQMVIDVVAYFVDGTAHEVVGTKDAKLVLDFVVVVAEVSCRRHRRPPSMASTPGVLLLVDRSSDVALWMSTIRCVTKAT